MKRNKKVIVNNMNKVLSRLEQYYSNITEPRPQNTDTAAEDVPNITNDKPFKTTVPLEDTEIPNPVIKTKKGKNVLVDPVPPEDNQIKDVEVFDKKGNELEDEEVENIRYTTFDDLYNDKEDTVEDLDENILFEQEDEDENGMKNLAQDNMGDQNPASGTDPNIDPNAQEPDPNGMMGADPSGMGMTQDPMGLGMGVEEPLSAENVGRVFELKKIYSRLLSIESQLSFSSDVILLKLRKFISKAIELFETLISNIDSFRNEIDGIIVIYYDFLKQVYLILKKYYKIKEKEDKKQNKNK